MTKTYLDALGEWARERAEKKPLQDKHAVAFLAVRSDVQAALDAGYAMKTIWRHMHEIGRLTCRYETFLNHVKRFDQAEQPPAAPPGITPSAKSPASTRPQPKPAQSAPAATSPPPALGGFTFDATPNKEELL